MSRKGENIYKRKDGRWEGRYIKKHRENTRAQYGYIYGASYKEVKVKLSEEIIKLKQNCEVVERKNQNKIKFAIIIKEYLQEKKVFLKESTIVKYQNLCKLYLIPELGESFLEELTNKRINEFSMKLLLNGGHKQKGLSPKTVSDILSLLHSVFDYADSRGLIIPATNITISIKQHKKQIRIFSIEEQKKLCKYLERDGGYTSLGILLCLFTGLRIGELCALKWQDISIENKTIFVHQTMQRLQMNKEDKKTEVLISTPKSTCSIRQIPISDKIFEILKKSRSSPESFFLTGLSSKYIEPRTLQYRFKRILKECEIEDANFHVLRHTFATRCVEVGFDVKSLSEILGHANVNITLNRYVHPSMELKRENMSKLSELFAVK